MVTKADMVGVYRGRGEQVVDAGGKVIHSANTSSGQIMYTADGYIGVVSTPAGRENLANSGGRTDLGGATAEELIAATRGVTCYAGRFEVKDGEVHHHVEMALNPNLIGQTMIRRVEFDGPDLTLSARPDAQGNVRKILWRRV
ncbi:MAG: lipocalin-like domain-containing protein [Hyphomicrobiales bacterium]|nr:lipocalin-like domain-containing protein [Alphaproteobacteria bacterium]